MSSKGSGSPSRSPSPSPPETEAASVEKKEEKKTIERSESPESASDASKSPSPEEDAAPGSTSSNETTPAEPSLSKPTEKEEEGTVPSVANAHVQGDWQAIWSPQYGMYYFYNMRTNETTWTNPLVPPDASATASTSNLSHLSAQEAAAAAGIDPDLAYLDPTLVAGPSAPSPFAYTAKFNARTGTFAKPDARNPEHVSEYERMRRMNNFYFDMDAWQQDVENGQQEEAGKKRKKPTKKDLEMFKERKKQKKLAKTAWLRT